LFPGRLGELVENHLAKFFQVVGDFDVEDEDVVMRMFLSTLEGEARAWYKSFMMLPFMDGIPSRRNSLGDGKIHQTFYSYAQFLQLLKSMKVKIFSNLKLVFPNFTIEFLTE
jgi:hypothetical protein